MKQSLLTLPGDAHCMFPGCEKTFTDEFLAAHLSKTWLGTQYKRHRERVLLERELAMLPATQTLLPNYKYAVALRSRIEQYDAARLKMQRQLLAMTRALANMRHEAHILKESNYSRRLQDSAGAAATEPRRHFIKACPVEGCRGFLSTAWKCGTCEARVCSKCGEPKHGDEHACDPDVAASHALLQRDSRPCPNCAAMIYKLDGCDQMFCTQCNVAFSWQTGRIVINGAIHNPHYYEWLRRTQGSVPRTVGDVPCGDFPGGFPTGWQVQQVLRTQKQKVAAEDAKVLYGLHRVLIHVMEEDMPKWRDATRDNPDRTLDLRLDYLLNRIDRDKFSRILQQREKRRKRAVEVLQVYDMLTRVASDIYGGLCRRTLSSDQAADQLRQVQEFANAGLNAISARFNMRVKRFRTSDT